MEDFDTFSIEGGDLYYKFQRAQDKLIPYDVMAKRAAAIVEAHSTALVSLEKDSVEWKWRHELMTRAYARMCRWERCGTSSVS